MKISNKANCIEPSLTCDLFIRAQKLADVISLTFGNPEACRRMRSFVEQN